MLKRLMVEEKGFTLVELLVTISILAVLFGIVTLTLSGVGSNAEGTVEDAELGVVQSAVDIYLAADASNSLAATTGSPAKLDGTEPFGAYLRFTSGTESKCLYEWTASGDVTQTSCP